MMGGCHEGGSHWHVRVVGEDERQAEHFGDDKSPKALGTHKEKGRRKSVAASMSHSACTVYGLVALNCTTRQLTFYETRCEHTSYTPCRYTSSSSLFNASASQFNGPHSP